MEPERLPNSAWAAGYVHRTACEPGLDFAFRAAPEDFEVEELAGCEPQGEGGHLWLWIEKRGLSTPDALRLLARALGRPVGQVRYAGLKDKHALARQWLSIADLEPARARGLVLPGLVVLRAERHPEPVRMGAIAGNRFVLRLRATPRAQRGALRRVLDQLAERGLANYFGAQRFGFSGAAHELGRLLVEGRHADYLCALASPAHAPSSPALEELAERIGCGTPAALRGAARLAPGLGPELGALARAVARRRALDLRAVEALPREWVRLHLSALQSRVFNRVLAERLAGPGIDALLEGDVPVDGAPSGPLPGWRLERAAGRVAELEARAWDAEGAAPERFRGVGRGLDRLGARRPLVARVRALELAFEGDDARLGFELPPGSYATTLVEELQKRLVQGRAAEPPAGYSRDRRGPDPLAPLHGFPADSPGEWA